MISKSTHNPPHELKEDDPLHVSAQLRGETMAFAAQSVLYNLGANFFEPYVNYRVQKYYSHNTAAHSGNYTQNLVGEFAGDIIGSSALILAEVACPEQLHATTRTLRSWIDPFYTPIAYKACADDKHDPDFEEKVQNWKVFQERNLVRSAFVGTAGLAGNLATQKFIIGNPSPTKIIFAGKLLSTALTTALGLTVRFAIPDQMNRIDQWIGAKAFTRWLDDKTIESDAPDSHVTRLNQQEQYVPSRSV